MTKDVEEDRVSIACDGRMKISADDRVWWVSISTILTGAHFGYWRSCTIVRDIERIIEQIIHSMERYGRG